MQIRSLANKAAKTTLVTGSTSGIGLGIARCLAAEGANIMINGFGESYEMTTICASIEHEFQVKMA